MVPNGWEKYPVGKLCKSIVPGRNKPKVFDGDIPWVTTPEISGKYIPSNKQKNFISQVVAKECGAKVVPKGAVVIAAVGELGLTAIATEEIILNQQLHAFVCPNDLDNEYLAYFLSAQTSYMDTVASKTTIPYMNKSNCESIPVLLPPLPEQRKIAKILSTWDKAISTTEALIKTSKQQKKVLMQQLLTGKKRLVDPETGEKFDGEWEEVKLNQLASITMGSSPKSEAYNEIGEGLPLLQGNADIKSRRSAPRIYTNQITKECSIGDILLSVRAPVGSVAKSDHKACIGRGIASIKAEKSNSQEYLYQWLLAFEPKWERLSQGSTFEAVNSNDIKTLNILAPTLIEQQKIASVLTAADKEIEIFESKLAHLKQEKKALMQQLLTGKRRVKVEEMEMA